MFVPRMLWIIINGYFYYLIIRLIWSLNMGQYHLVLLQLWIEYWYWSYFLYPKLFKEQIMSLYFLLNGKSAEIQIFSISANIVNQYPIPKSCRELKKPSKRPFIVIEAFFSAKSWKNWSWNLNEVFVYNFD